VVTAGFRSHTAESFACPVTGFIRMIHKVIYFIDAPLAGADTPSSGPRFTVFDEQS
jgi:hypothetical protein